MFVMRIVRNDVSSSVVGGDNIKERVAHVVSYCWDLRCLVNCTFHTHGPSFKDDFSVSRYITSYDRIGE